MVATLKHDIRLTNDIRSSTRNMSTYGSSMEEHVNAAIQSSRSRCKMNAELQVAERPILKHVTARRTLIRCTSYFLQGKPTSSQVRVHVFSTVCVLCVKECSSAKLQWE
jgi:hypothetical protein